MGILDEDVQRVRAETDVVGVISERVALKKSGRRYQGLCPFHAEKTPSFSVNAEEGLYYCFGCQAKGDVITFVREVDHLDFVEAVERLAARAGIQLRYDQAAGGRDRKRRDLLLDTMTKAVDWYHERLLSSADAAPARGYLRSRGYDGDIVRRFRLGWAPDEWDALARQLGVADDILEDTGLGFLNRRGRQQDGFRSRVMFPIFDTGDKPVAFGGRILPGAPADQPKYKNSPETPIYSKRRTLYGLNWAKSDIVDAGEVIVCEGYTDVIGFAGAGLARAVATCGTAVGDEHFRMLKNFARRVVLAYDADAAGQAAAERFYEWEQQLGVDIAVAAFPAGTDPADMARRDPSGLKSAIEKAQPFLAFRVERELAGADLRSPESRARAAEHALAIVAEHPNDLVRNEYIGRIAATCDIPFERLRSSIKSVGRNAVVRPVERTVRMAEGPELNALRLAIARPAEMVDRLAEAMFAEELHAAAYRALANAATLHEAIEQADPGASALLQRLAVEDTDAEPLDVIALLLERITARAIADLERSTKASGIIEESAPSMSWLKLTREQLFDPATRVEASERLVAWLSERGGEEEL
ncbi:MAG TPA: DNA primase [Acidimicrobiales bacterium]|nr:DNA primase [Acidimicrobiales bacterium]